MSTSGADRLTRVAAWRPSLTSGTSTWTIGKRFLPVRCRLRRDLRIARSPLEAIDRRFLVIDQLFSRERLGRWIDHRTPVGRPDLVS